MILKSYVISYLAENVSKWQRICILGSALNVLENYFDDQDIVFSIYWSCYINLQDFLNVNMTGYLPSYRLPTSRNVRCNLGKPSLFITLGPGWQNPNWRSKLVLPAMPWMVLLYDRPTLTIITFTITTIITMAAIIVVSFAFALPLSPPLLATLTEKEWGQVENQHQN